MQLSRNFERAEFACRCGCGFDGVSMRLVSALQQLRDGLGKPVRVTSACRCAAHNKRCGGAAKSTHLSGRAADVKVAGLTPADIAREAEEIPAFRDGGMGRYKTFLHLDVRGHRARW